MSEQLELRVVRAQAADMPRIIDLYQRVISSVAGTEYDVRWELGSRPTFEELENAVAAGEMLLCLGAPQHAGCSDGESGGAPQRGGSGKEPESGSAAQPAGSIGGEPELLGAAIVDHSQAQGYEQVPWQCQPAPHEVFCLHLFCVSPQHTRCGLGSQFLQLLLDEARARGARSLRLDVLPNNIPAQKLYKKNGFIDHGFFHLFYGEGLLTDFYLMEKVLD